MSEVSMLCSTPQAICYLELLVVLKTYEDFPLLQMLVERLGNTDEG